MTTALPKLLTRDGARRYLEDVWGFVLAASSLERLAQRKGGPEYSVVAGRAYYRVEDLDAWANEQLNGAGRCTD